MNKPHRILNHIRMFRNQRLRAVVLLVLLGGSTIAIAQSAKVTVAPVPLLGSPSWSNNQFRVSIATTLGVNYTLEYKTSVTSTQWTNASSVSGNGTVQVLTDSAAAIPRLRIHGGYTGFGCSRVCSLHLEPRATFTTTQGTSYESPKADRLRGAVGGTADKPGSGASAGHINQRSFGRTQHESELWPGPTAVQTR
jgi:hypothetical protein